MLAAAGEQQLAEIGSFSVASPFLFAVVIALVSPIASLAARRRITTWYQARAARDGNTVRNVDSNPEVIAAWAGWSADVVQASSATLSPLVGLVFATEAQLGTGLVRLYLLYFVGGFALFSWVLAKGGPFGDAVAPSQPGRNLISPMVTAITIIANIVAAIVAGQLV